MSAPIIDPSPFTSDVFRAVQEKRPVFILGRRYVCDDDRRVVVIDFDNAEHVQRLLSLIYKQAPKAAGSFGYLHLKPALREFASPPKPDEPTGLGAVVEDAEGKRYVRADDPPDVDWNLDKPWRHGAGWSIRSHWQIVPAVRVLSEGVQP